MSEVPRVLKAPEAIMQGYLLKYVARYPPPSSRLADARSSSPQEEAQEDARPRTPLLLAVAIGTAFDSFLYLCCS